MDEAERIPIVIEQPAELAANEELREDGTLVVDIAAESENCLQADADVDVEDDTIVVCAQVPEEMAEGDGNPLVIRLSEHATLTPTAQSVAGGAGGSGVEAKVTLRVEF